MKRLLLILITIFFWGNIIAHQNNSCIEVILQEKSSPISKDIPITFSIYIPKAHVYLSNKVISFNFNEIDPVVTISIINKATGKTIYLETYNESLVSTKRN